jgi:hypothetical protein
MSTKEACLLVDYIFDANLYLAVENCETINLV